MPIEQVYQAMQTEIDNLYKQVVAADEQIRQYQTTTQNMEWEGTARDAVEGTLQSFRNDMERLRTKIEDFMRAAGVSAEKMQEMSTQAMLDVNAIKA